MQVQPGTDVFSSRHDAIIERIRRLRLRVTPQRVLVMEALSSAGGHMTADAIMRWTAERYPAINLATIYRTLDVLTSAGLVTQTDLGGDATYFELVGDSLHHHLVCQHCGVVTDVDDAILAPVRERVLREKGFLASARHMAIFGVCRGCHEAQRAQAVTLAGHALGVADVAGEADDADDAEMPPSDALDGAGIPGMGA